MVTVSPTPPAVPPRRALAIPPLRQQVNLAVGVGGTLGGVLLLSTNLVFLAMAPIATLPWIPLSANAALIFGGIMFAREYRRRTDG